uniref:N-acylglucosamine 2-epimerase n=2 Tax=Ciona intestinalis TaxID=7719 RepID=F6SSK4_CIOIN
MGDQRTILQEWLNKIQAELESVVKFWTTHSHDVENGGFFNCLDKDGKVYDEIKYTWLQARQVWMYCRLYVEVERFHTPDILEAARNGADFLLEKCLIKQNGFTRCPFSVAKDGATIKVQRTMFAECFYVLAMSEMGRASTEEKYKVAARDMMRQIKHWCLVDTEGLGRENIPGSSFSASLAVPLMAYCVWEQMLTCEINWSDDAEVLQKWALDKMLQHIQRNGQHVLENVSDLGEELPGSAGRLQIPGHAIEGGWFLLQNAMMNKDKELAEKALTSFINKPFEQGWDKVNKGIFYFLDVEGYSPTQLEWNMKLWWPLNEAMIAFLMAYQYTADNSYLEKFQTVAEYTFAKFPDKQHGGWYGYLDNKGELTHRFKGGPWKGFFHVPRSLYMCEKILKKLL